jgi:hypothetical protein
MNSVQLPALRPSHPLGWLAAVGCLARLAERGARLSWASSSDTTPSALLEGFTSLEDVVDALDHVWADEAERGSLVEGAVWPPTEHLDQRDGPYDRAKVLADQYGRRAAQLGVANTGQRWLRATVTDLALGEHGAGRVASTSELYLLSKRQTFVQQLKTLWKLTPSARRATLRRGLTGWTRDTEKTGMNFDLGGNVTGAESPTGEPGVAVPGGATWLAVGALRLMPTTLDRGQVATRGWTGDGHRRLRLPTWTAPLDPVAVECLISHPDVVSEAPDASTRRRLDALGVGQLWESRLVERRPAGTPEYFLGIAERVS